MLIEGAARISFAQPLLKTYDSIRGMPNRLDADIHKSIESDTSDGDVVLFPYSYDSVRDIYKYSMLARAFELRGYRPLFIVCDTVIPHSNYRSESLERSYWEIKKYQTNNILDKFGFNKEKISRYIGNKHMRNTVSKEETKRYRGVNVDKFAKASTRKSLRKYHISSLKDEKVEQRFRRSAVLLVDAYEKLINSRDIDIVISHEDKYNHGGIPLAVAANNNIPAYSTGFGWKNNSLVMSKFTDRNSFPHYEKTETIEKFIRKPLSNENNTRVDEIMSERMNQRDSSHTQYAAQTKKSVEVSECATTIGMFTNLIWDASLEASNCPYPNVFNWIRQTIEYFQTQDECELIIKTHPAEEMRKTNELVSDWLRQNYPDLQDNIKILEPDTDVNTYRLIEDLDATIVYNSTVGLEAAYAGTPVIVAGDTHYRNIGISYDPSTKSEYLNLLERISEISMSNSQMRRARRYIYFLFEIKHLEFPYIVGGKRNSDTYRSVSDAEIVGDNTLMGIVDYCSKNEPILIVDRHNN